MSIEAIAEADLDFEIKLRSLIDKGQLDILDLLIIWLRLIGFKQKEVAERLHITSHCVRKRRMRMKTLWRKMI